MFTDLTLAMQKLYQTFVAQAAQLQSVHENVKVGFNLYKEHNDKERKKKKLSISRNVHPVLCQCWVCFFSWYQILKHQYLSYRRAFLEDSTDVFESKRASSRKWQGTPKVTTGPAPFSSVPNAAAVAMAATLTQQQQPTPGLTAYKF